MTLHKKWLISLNVCIAMIVIIGGITRLTDSGLSMVTWKPIMGSIPPITQEQWLRVFDAYKSSPEYLTRNFGMSLSQFKVIFFWEYLHRMIGRVIGLVALLPFLCFWLKKSLPQRLKKRGFLIIGLIILQGIMGWIMVKSGLSDIPDVSHFRLAVHLGLAFLLFQIILWEILYIHFNYPEKTRKPLLKTSRHLLGILFLQIIIGAFVAGLNAGYGYNTWPKMGDFWIPPTAFSLSPLLSNLINNPVMIQFIHRTVGLLIGVSTIALIIKSKKTPLPKTEVTLVRVVWISILLQIIVGIKTLLFMIPLPLALLHQFLGLICLSSVTFLLFTQNHSIKYKSKKF
jgi:cytochrome c oxidase assembly protein subunit 15